MELNNIHIKTPMPEGSAPSLIELELNTQIESVFQQHVFPHFELDVLRGQRIELSAERVFYRFHLDFQMAKALMQAMTVACFELDKQQN